MKIRKIISVLLILTLVMISFTGCKTSSTSSNADDKKSEKKLTYIFVHPASTLDPHLKANAYITLRAGIAETLVKIDENLKIKPWLLESWSSKDGKNWELKVRKGITFQNGTILDANMVKLNIERIIQKNEGIKKALNIKSMEAKENTLKVVLDKPNLSLPSEFVHPNTAIIDVNTDNIDEKPVGTGPFKVESFKSNASVNLVKNEKYWDGEVKLDRVSFEFNEDANARVQALQSGYADIIFKPALEAIDTFKNDSKFKIDNISGLRTHEILYNTKRANTNNEYFRKGIDSLINRQEIVDTIMAGQATPAYGPFMEKFPFSINYEKNEFGVNKALENFKKAGLTVNNGKVLDNGKPIKLRVVSYSSRPELPQIAQVIQSNAKQMGIDMDINIVEDIDEYLSKNSNWDITVYSLLTAPRGDASYYLNSSFVPDGVMNHGHVNDSELTATINKFNTTGDEAKRLEFAKKAVTIINKKNYNSYVAYPNIVVVYNNNRVVNWVTSASEYYMITKDLDVK